MAKRQKRRPKPEETESPEDVRMKALWRECCRESEEAMKIELENEKIPGDLLNFYTSSFRRITNPTPAVIELSLMIARRQVRKFMAKELEAERRGFNC